MDDTWTLTELVEHVAQRLAALPPPKNGQVRAVPDERTVRYYGTLGLLDRPVATRGRTALYDRRHLAQVVAIKRLQSLGRSLAEIQAMWPTLDDATLARMSGVPLEASPTAGAPPRASRAGFWHGEHVSPSTPAAAPGRPAAVAPPSPAAPRTQSHTRQRSLQRTQPRSPQTSPPPAAPVELRIELAPGAVLALAMPGDAITLSAADVRAIRAAAAPLIAELARHQLTTPDEEKSS